VDRRATLTRFGCVVAVDTNVVVRLLVNGEPDLVRAP